MLFVYGSDREHDSFTTYTLISDKTLFLFKHFFLAFGTEAMGKFDLRIGLNINLCLLPVSFVISTILQFTQIECVIKKNLHEPHERIS